jgi:DNA-binding IclR family transcriptional regulator
VPVPAIERAVRVLQALGGKGDGLGLSEFSRLVGISKSTLSNILVSLEKLGLVERDPQSLTYRLGVGLLELTQPVLGKLDLRQLAHAHLVKLRDSTGETAILHVPSGENAVVVDRAEPDRQLKVVAPLGLRLPRFAGSVSKVFLAALPVQEAETLVRRSRLPAFTPRSVTEPDRFLRELAEVRRTGFASDDEEYLPGVRAVSASIRGAGGRAVGAISIAGVRGHLGNVRMKELAGAVVAAAEQVSRVNGVGVNFPSATETYGN